MFLAQSISVMTAAIYHWDDRQNSNRFSFSILCDWRAIEFSDCHHDPYSFYKFVSGLPLNLLLCSTLNYLIYSIYHHRMKNKRLYHIETGGRVTRGDPNSTPHGSQSEGYIPPQISSDLDPKDTTDTIADIEGITDMPCDMPVIQKPHTPQTQTLLSYPTASTEDILDVELAFSETESDSSLFDDDTICSSNEYIGVFNDDYNHIYEFSCHSITTKYFLYLVSSAILLFLYLFFLHLAMSVTEDGILRSYTKLSFALHIVQYVFCFTLKHFARNMDILRMQKPKDIFSQTMPRDFNQMVTFLDILKYSRHHKLSMEVMAFSFARGYG